MANQQPNGNGRLTARGFTGARARQTPPYHFQESSQASGPCEPQPEPEQAADPATDRTNRLDWQMVALWIFVAVSFAAFVFAGYLIWAKSRGPSLF